MEVVVERVGPENHLARCPPLRLTRATAHSSTRAHFAKLCVASRGISRCGARCSTRFTRPVTPGAFITRFASRGVSDPSAAHLSIKPNAYASSGRRRAFVVVREKLRAVGRDVDVRRALRLARLARQAQVERLLHFFALPRIGQHLALQQLPQAGARGRACCGALRASPCSSGTSCRSRACGTRRARCSASSPSRTIPCRRETRRTSPAGPGGSRRRAADSPSAGTRRSACAGSSGSPGSHTALNSPNARISSGPNIFGSSAPRDWPSPCSPESDPP